MTEVRFYHLTKTSLDEALPKMLEKVIERGQKAVVFSADERRLEELNQSLWSYRPESFLPHGTKRDGGIESHPIWLTTKSDDLDTAEVVFIVHGASPERLENETIKLCAILFDGNNSSAVQDAREFWKELKAADHELTYWQQNVRGSWEKKA
ncbi:DNA polymerase III subunit chi [Kiloniella antarctica]|uniref:DNA polymerase III subunit chi n=1 Tax=Kiloniella antarctica TaxID=1550907 RepID=A0ABW5BNR8_9PROT